MKGIYLVTLMSAVLLFISQEGLAGPKPDEKLNVDEKILMIAEPVDNTLCKAQKKLQDVIKKDEIILQAAQLLEALTNNDKAIFEAINLIQDLKNEGQKLVNTVNGMGSEERQAMLQMGASVNYEEILPIDEFVTMGPIIYSEGFELIKEIITNSNSLDSIRQLIQHLKMNWKSLSRGMELLSGVLTQTTMLTKIVERGQYYAEQKVKG